MLQIIQDYKITTFCAPPTIYRYFIKEDLNKYDLSALKYATTAGEALNPEVFDQFKRCLLYTSSPSLRYMLSSPINNVMQPSRI